MSDRYPGGFITKTPVVPTPSSASGVWTLDQQLQAQKSGTWPFGGPFTYIEDVFSTYLYTGTGATQTITNGIDLSGKGGLVWYKSRSDATDHELVDTVRGGTKYIQSNSTSGQGTLTSTEQLSFSSTGFSIGGSNFNGNQSGKTYASWTFRKQPQFFDVVTYTGTGVNGRAVAHNLGATPGCIIVKKTSASNDWRVYHRSLGTPAYNYFMSLNTTQAKFDTATATMWTAAPTSTNFYVSDQSEVNESGATYVAYLFAHDAGGFGLTGTDNVISCGSYTGTGAAGNAITLGYEPQWIMVKGSSAVTNWEMFDNMRGVATGGNDALLRANGSNAEDSTTDRMTFNSTGFTPVGTGTPNASGATYIYIAIRRGPMKTPTSGTSVYLPQAYADISLGTSNPTTLGASAGFPVDFFMHSIRTGTTFCANIFDRLRGSDPALLTSSTAAEDTGEPLNAYSNAFDTMSGVKSAYDNRYYYYSSAAGTRSHIGWFLRRAPGFFDEVCYTGTGSARTVNHNLGVAPELMIVKNRNNAENWGVYSAALGNTKRLRLNSTDAAVTASAEWNNTSPTASVFTVGTDQEVNFSGNTYVAYLFASCPGVSKVGSYTGTGTTLQIDCGFTGGARFVLIKRTDSTGDWYVWDSARGIVAGNDPYLLLNSTAAEVTSTDYVDTYSAGFEISSTAPAAINANGGTYIFLAIA